MSSRGIGYLGLVAVFALAGCGKDTEPDVVIPATTKIADDATMTALTAVNADGSLTFSQSTGVLDSLAVGDILNGTITPMTPYGLLRKVTSIDRSGGQVTLQTVQGTLGEAIERGSFDFRKEVDMADVMNPLRTRPGLTDTTVTFDHGVRIGFNGFSESYSTDSGVGGTLNLDGFLRFNPVFAMHGDIRNFHVYSFDISLEFEGESDLTVGAELNLALDKEVEILNMRLATISFFIGPVLVVMQPTLEFKATLGGSAALSLTFHETGAYDGVTGTAYDDHTGWSPLNRGNSTGTIDPMPTGALAVELHAYVGVVADVLLYGVISSGPIFEIKFGPQLDFATPRDPFLQAGLRLIADFQLHLYILGHEFGTYTLAEYSRLFPIFSSPNTPPSVLVTSPPNNSSFLPYEGIHFIAAVYDLEDGGTIPVTWTSDVDGLIGTGDDFTTTLHATPPGPGLRNITVTAVDHTGLSRSVTFQLTIEDPGAPAVIAEPYVGQALFAYDSVVRGSATSPFYPGADLCTAGFIYTWTSGRAGDVIGPIQCHQNSARANITYVGSGTRILTFGVTDPYGVHTSAARLVNVQDPPTTINFGSAAFSTPAPGTSISTAGMVLINPTVDPRKVITDPLPFPTAVPLTYQFSATSYAADGTTPIATVDIGSKVETDKLTAGMGNSQPITWSPGSTPGFIDPAIAATGAGQMVLLQFTAIDGIGHLGNSAVVIRVTP